MKFNNIRVYNIELALHGMRNPLESWDKSDTTTGICKVDDFTNVAKEHIQKWGVSYPSFNRIIEALNDIIIYNDGKYAEYVSIGPKDMKLMETLVKGGTEHRKFLRQIFVTVDITAPLYFWKEFDTYKIGTVSNSTSTMHKLASTPITLDCFEIDDYNPDLVYLEGIDDHGDNKLDYSLSIKDMVEATGPNTYFEPTIIQFLEELRLKYLETKDKRYWKELIRWLPESWLQTRTVTLNYENLVSIMQQRKNHKLNEWSGTDQIESPNFINFVKQLPYMRDILSWF